MPGYPAVLHEAARVLRPGGAFVHVGVHPCFCGGFADRGDLDAVVIRPGYLDSRWTKRRGQISGCATSCSPSGRENTDDTMIQQPADRGVAYLLFRMDLR